MRYFKDIKGKKPAKPGDKVAFAKSSIDEKMTIAHASSIGTASSKAANQTSLQLTTN